jgi:membrane associated rhomboid family serine protease
VGIRLLPAGRRRFPIVATVLTIAIGVPSLLQFAHPSITAALERDPDLTLHHDQWWRVITAILAQDGGLPGAIFNLLVVAFVTTLGEWIWGRWRMLLLFLLPSIVLNLLAVVFWNASGGGSSFASDGLMMSMCGLGLVVSKRLAVRICALAAVAIGVVLVVLGDAHGVAVLLGAALGILFALPRQGLRNR